jgi:hypothetical protein
MEPFELVAEELLVATPDPGRSPASEPPSSRPPDISFVARRAAVG